MASDITNEQLDEMLQSPHDGYIQNHHPSDFVAMQNPKGIIIALHGFDLLSNNDPGLAFQPAVDTIRQRYEPQGYVVIAPKYNTHESFVYAAKHIYDYLTHSHWPLDNVHMFGYSMGGLVARQIAVNGINPTTLVTFCSPNQGTAAWVPTPNNGAMSLAPWSQDLNNLNNHPRDKEMRSRYTMIGLSYLGTGNVRQYNDGMVEVVSANMMNASPPPGTPLHWNSVKQGWLGPFQPHADAQAFPEVQSALTQFFNTVG